MGVVATILKILLVLVCLAMIVLVMMQEGNENGLSSSIAGGAGASETSFAARNSGRTKEGQLKKYTRILLAAFMVIALVLNIIG